MSEKSEIFKKFPKWLNFTKFYKNPKKEYFLKIKKKILLLMNIF